MDNKKSSILPDNALTELTKGVYTDVGHPILKEVGSIGASLMKLVALPFKFLGMTADELESKYAEFLKNTINKVEPEERVVPKAVVVSPLLEHVKFVFDEDGLSEMFSNLLANAMNCNIEKMVHPAFVEMLKQMSPLDVEFMDLYFSDSDIVEMASLNWERGTLQRSLTADSLSRLGIIRTISYDDRDDVAIMLTDFGKVFRNLCMLKPADINPEDFFKEDDRRPDEDYVNSDDIGLAFEEDFGSVRISPKDGTPYIRAGLEMEDIRKGSQICIHLRINNIGNTSKQIEEVLLDCGVTKHIAPYQNAPITIPKGAYHDYLFIPTKENNLLTCALRERTRYRVHCGDTVYDLQLSDSTKREIELYLRHADD